MLHDEKMFGSNPGDFKPERFLVPGVTDPSSIAFGFGRRCVVDARKIRLCS